MTYEKYLEKTKKLVDYGLSQLFRSGSEAVLLQHKLNYMNCQVEKFQVFAEVYRTLGLEAGDALTVEIGSYEINLMTSLSDQMKQANPNSDQNSFIVDDGDTRHLDLTWTKE